MIEKIIKKLGIEKHITSHCARHTFATLLRDAGSDLNNIKDIAGHSDTSMTQIYAKMTPKKLSDEMDKLDKMLGS
jgi:site-specific recombinase XerD